MKKWIALLLALVLALSLTACSKGMADGVYTAELDDASAEAAHGWRDTLVVEYKDGKIVSATFESYDADGNKKSEATAEEYPMDPAPSQWIPAIGAAVLEAGEAKRIDGVAGATNSSNNAKALLEAIEEKGVAGETVQISTVTE